MSIREKFNDACINFYVNAPGYILGEDISRTYKEDRNNIREGSDSKIAKKLGVIDSHLFENAHFLFRYLPLAMEIAGLYGVVNYGWSPSIFLASGIIRGIEGKCFYNKRKDVTFDKSLIESGERLDEVSDDFNKVIERMKRLQKT